MNNNILFLLLSILLIGGCSSEGRRMKTETGYEYQIVRKGGSELIPIGSYVFFHMALTQKDSVIQSTATMGKPTVLKLNENNNSYGQLASLVDVMKTMHDGDSMLFYFPVDSFDRMPPGFDKFTEPMVYHVGIVDVMDEAQYQAYSDSIQNALEASRQVVRDRLPEVEALAKSNWDAYKKGELDSQMKTTASGLRYVVHENGQDGTAPKKGDQVSVHYYGMLDADAKMFDASFRAGQPLQFPIGMGQVIPGWDEGVMLLNKGAKATLFIPAELGYGATGAGQDIPANADLIFYVEIE